MNASAFDQIYFLIKDPGKKITADKLARSLKASKKKFKLTNT